MKKFFPILLSSILVLGAAACQSAKTSADAPDSTDRNATTPNTEDVRDTQADATSQVREAQRQADTRAIQQRNNAGDNLQNIADNDIESLVRNKLEENLPSSQLTVDSEDGVVTIAGNVTSQEQLDRIEPLATQVRGVKSVDLKATVATPKPEGSNESTESSERALQDKESPGEQPAGQ